MDKLSENLVNVGFEKNTINIIFNFDYNKLDTVDSSVLTKYCVVIAQYLIYYQFTLNKLKVEIKINERFIESVIGSTLTKNFVSKFSTKKDALLNLMNTDAAMLEANERLNNAKDELMLIEGIDKHLTELIGIFKRELTRREHEYNFTRR